MFKSFNTSSIISREFLIGYNYINKLRNIVPNFVYTYGSFKLPIDTIKNLEIKKQTIILEKIEGTQLAVLLSDNSINFDDWLNIYCQLLFALEIAQREVNFTHFDLHCQNIIVRKVKSGYKLIMDNNIYEITYDYLPVIIDFGTSCISDNNNFLGSHDYKKYGMLNFMIPGQDMYKIIISSLSYCKDKKLYESISSLLNFYEYKDPYSILSDKNGLSLAISEYCKKITFSLSAIYTPHNFLEWIFKNYIVKKFIKVKKRNILRFSSDESIYLTFGKLLSQKYNTKKIISSIFDDITFENKSYLISSYNLELILKTFGRVNKEIKTKIKQYKLKLRDKKYLQDIDEKLLQLYFSSVIIPDYDDFSSISLQLLNINLLSKSYQDKIRISNEIKKLINFENIFLKYLDLYYMILELKLEDKYKDWCLKFLKSEPYLFYIKYISLINKSKRWVKSLHASIS